MTGGRTDYKPAPTERRILEGRALPTPSPRYELSAAIRRLNQLLGALPPERQRELMDDWGASFEELQRQRQAARTDADELASIQAWADHWEGLLT